MYRCYVVLYKMIVTKISISDQYISRSVYILLMFLLGVVGGVITIGSTSDAKVSVYTAWWGSATNKRLEIISSYSSNNIADEIVFNIDPGTDISGKDKILVFTGENSDAESDVGVYISVIDRAGLRDNCCIHMLYYLYV